MEHFSNKGKSLDQQVYFLVSSLHALSIESSELIILSREIVAANFLQSFCTEDPNGNKIPAFTEKLSETLPESVTPSKESKSLFPALPPMYKVGVLQKTPPPNPSSFLYALLVW